MEKLILRCNGCIDYIDDILILDINEEHGQRLSEVLQILKDDFKLNKDK